jgi:Plasmid encoded RepA protein
MKEKRETQNAKILRTAQDVFYLPADEAGELAFMSKCFIQATLPHSDPGDVPIWGRKNGDYALTIQPHFMLGDDGQPRNIGLPYGTVPRLILAWANGEVVKTRSRELILGKSLTDFMDKIGFGGATGGKNGSITRLKNQSMRLFSAKLSLTYQGAGKLSIANALLADYAEYFWDPLHPGQQSLWDSRVMLSERFYSLLLSAPVPLDWRILKSLKRSPLALDLYMWLSYRMFALKKPQTIRWETLSKQFGAEYSRVVDFRANVRKHILKIQGVWQELKIDASADDTIILFPSRLLIAPKS